VDPGSGDFLAPGSGIRDGKKSGSGMNIPDYFSESLETVLGLMILEFFYTNLDLGSIIFLIRDPGWKNSVPGSGINIPDPQH
jgi:hypothetical protein